jgi:hypothetical protein
MTQFSRQPLSYRLLVLLIVAASCLRVFVCFQHNPMDYLFSDPLRHWHNGLRFPMGGYTGAGDPIGYQVYTAALYRLTHGNRILVALASSILSVLMPWTYYRAARSFGMRKVASLWVWALIAWTPSLLAIYHYIMMETLLLLLEGLALWMTGRYLRKGGTGPFLWFVCCWALACLTKPTVVPLAGVCLLWTFWKKRPSWRALTIGAAIGVVMLIPQSIRTKIELGFYAPFGNPWLAKIIHRDGARLSDFHFYVHLDNKFGFRPQVPEGEMEFGSPSCFIQPLSPLSQWVIRRARLNSKARVVIDFGAGERDWKAAYESFNDDPYERMAQWRENIVLFLFAPSWPETAVGQWDGHLEYGARWMWAPLVVIVLLFNLLEFVKRRFDLIPVGVTVLTLVLMLQNEILMEGRYRKPVEPLLLLNLVWLIARWRARNQVNDSTPAEVVVSA